MKNKDIFDLLENLDKVKTLQGVEFALLIARNIRLLKQEAEILEQANQVADGFMEFENQRIEICKKHANKDELGFCIMDKDKRFTFSDEGRKSFDEEMIPLQEKYANIIKKQEELNEEYLKLLEKDSILELNKIDIKDLPKDISAEQLDIIYDSMVIKEN